MGDRIISPLLFRNRKVRVCRWDHQGRLRSIQLGLWQAEYQSQREGPTLKFWTEGYVSGIGWIWQDIDINIHFDWLSTDIPTFQPYVLKDLCRTWKEAVLWDVVLQIIQQVFEEFKRKVKVSQSCLTICDLMDVVHGIHQVRILEWVAFPFSRGSSQPQHRTQVSHICRQILYQLNYKGSPRILEWVAYPFFRKSSWPTNQTRVSCIAGGLFTSWAMRKGLCKRGHFDWKDNNLQDWQIWGVYA